MNHSLIQSLWHKADPIQVTRSFIALLLLPAFTSPILQASELPELNSMGLEQLMDLEVATASRKSQPLSHTAAAAFIISRARILKSGATSLPEALRLAPGIDAAQITPNEWSVTIRGSSGQFSNKLLVLIDGRSVYTPTFGGVYWEQQDIPLDNIDHIEVIRGPGATLWGANAVNGVINIITRHTAETTGTQIQAKAGNQQQSLTLRHGVTLGDKGFWRLNASTRQADGWDNRSGHKLDNGFEQQQVGFRADISTTDQDELSLQGRALQLHDHQAFEVPDLLTPPTFLRVVNSRSNTENLFLSARWEHTASIDSTFVLQSYLQQYQQQTYTTTEHITTLDLDFQHHFAKRHHDVVWGLGYRQSKERFNDEGILANLHRTNHRIYNGFIQDEIELSPDHFWLIIGSKLEHNDDTNLEPQPSLRALWRQDAHHTLWGSITRAVRTPTRSDTDIDGQKKITQPDNTALPVIINIQGNPHFRSETLTAWELGYRFKATSDWSLDTTLFYHDYDHIRYSHPTELNANGDHFQQNFEIDNALLGTGYGLELASYWAISPTVQMQLSYTAQTLDFRFKPGQQGIDEPNENPFLRASPKHILSLNTLWSLQPTLDWDFWLRAVSDEPADRAEGYVTLDTKIGWQPRPGIRLALIGKNLLQPHHFEYDEEGYAINTEIPRSLMVTLTLDY